MSAEEDLGKGIVIVGVVAFVIISIVFICIGVGFGRIYHHPQVGGLIAFSVWVVIAIILWGYLRRKGV